MPAYRVPVLVYPGDWTMRLSELLDELKDCNPDDIIGIGVYLGGGEWESTAIDHVAPGAGISILCTPENDVYRNEGTEL